MLVVADGVGGQVSYLIFKKIVVDPGFYSKELCQHIEKLFTEYSRHYILNPKELIVDAHELTKAIGSTTVCLMTLEDHKLILRTAFVGNSAYAIYRIHEEMVQLIFKSKE